MMLRVVFLSPQYPAINAHDGVVQVHACLANEAALEADVNVNDRVYQPYGIYQDVFCAAEPYTGNAGKYCNEFQQAGVAHAINKLPVNFLQVRWGYEVNE